MQDSEFILKKDGRLFVEDCLVRDIASHIPTPFYCYSRNSIVANYNEFKSVFTKITPHIHYAVKACHNINIIRILAEIGSGVDTVSIGEIKRAIFAGIEPSRIVFSGVGKTRSEILYALEIDIGQINVESLQELYLINEIAKSIDKKAKIAFRINPDIDANTHASITTGKKDNKFGIPREKVYEYYDIAKNLDNIEIFGITAHIGSQINSHEPFVKLFAKIREIYLNLLENGTKLSVIDLGGGVGIKYKDEVLIDLKKYAEAVEENFGDLEVKILFEPGRKIVGNSCILVTKVLYTKSTESKNFLIVDAAMNDIKRPSMYDAYHHVIPINDKDENNEELVYDIVGPICESADTIGKDRKFSNIKNGEFLAILSAGAYCSSMSSEYNSRPLVPEILVNGDKYTIIRKKPSFEDMIKLEV